MRWMRSRSDRSHEGLPAPVRNGDRAVIYGLRVANGYRSVADGDLDASSAAVASTGGVAALSPGLSA